MLIPEPYYTMLLDAVAGRKPLAEAQPERIRAIDSARKAAQLSYPDIFVSAAEEAARGLQPRRRISNERP